MQEKSADKPRRDLVPYGTGLVPEWWAERVAICVVMGGLSEEDARRVANAEMKARSHEQK